jgi:hypothetical protein
MSWAHRALDTPAAPAAARGGWTAAGSTECGGCGPAKLLALLQSFYSHVSGCLLLLLMGVLMGKRRRSSVVRCAPAVAFGAGKRSGAERRAAARTMWVRPAPYLVASSTHSMAMRLLLLLQEEASSMMSACCNDCEAVVARAEYALRRAAQRRLRPSVQICSP